MKTPNQAEYIRPADVKQMFGISRATLYRLIALGKIQTKQLQITGEKRGIRLIPVSELQKLISPEEPSHSQK